MNLAVRRCLVAFCAAAAAVLVSWQAPPARGSGDLVVDLGPGGRVYGDISSTSGEIDAVGVDLVAGQSLRATCSSTFDADVLVLGPTGATIPFFEGTQRSRSIPHGYVVGETGRYRIEIRSPGGAEGRYALAVLPSWARVLRFEGAAPATLEFGMPAGSAVKGRVAAAPGSSGPAISALRDPTGSDLLPGPIAGRRRSVKLPSTQCVTVGAYAVDVAATGGDGRWSASLVRHTTRIPLGRIDARNGVNGVGFEAGGVRDLLVHRCAGCHDWATGYKSARSYARQALARMRSGDMPAVGPPIGPAGIALFRSWIEAGYPR